MTKILVSFLQFYNASITNVTDNTYVVLFNDYGNVEEVLKSDCKPLNPDRQQKGHQNQRYYPRKFYSGKFILQICF